MSALAMSFARARLCARLLGILALTCTTSCGPDAEGAGGAGTSQAPGAVAVTRAASELYVEIDTCAELQAMNLDRDASYRLTADIDCTGFDAGDGGGFMPVGSSNPYAPFYGSFIGDGHVITGLTINRPSTTEVGLFGYWAPWAPQTIEQVGFEDVSITGFLHVGAVGGFVSDLVEIDQVYVTGSVVGDDAVGALVGRVHDGPAIVDSYSLASVTAGQEPFHCGLMVGKHDGTLTNTFSAGALVSCPVSLAVLEGGTTAASFFDCDVAGSCAHADAETTATLQSPAHFSAAGWDLEEVWGFASASSYPCLRWQTGCGGAPDGGVPDAGASDAGAPCATSDATCDGEDDDCDLSIDEDFATSATSCGTGACAASGTLTCVSGEEQDSCTPGTAAGSDASCNGVDDDCNGAVDEDYASTATSCGVGACAASGTLACVGGSVQDSCTPGSPAGSDAVCNGVDDDCNGAVDDDYVSVATGCGVGACAAVGVSACVGGAVQDSCVPGVPSADTTCNGVDEDCDGVVDDGFAVEPTTCTVAGCYASGQLICTAGGVEDTCLTSPTCVAEVACTDSSDNDGDGAVDCADSDCAADVACVAVPEICGNTLDDDLDQLFDCADPDCFGDPLCLDPPTRAADVAPPLPTTEPPGLYESTRFLYAGPSPVQVFTDPESIEPNRVALLTGRVLAADGDPLPNARVRVLRHAELGESITDVDGAFFMAVNGGETLVLEFSLSSHLPVHRSVATRWNDTVPLDDVVLTALDPATTSVALNGATTQTQVARGSVVTDEDGTRQATVLMPPGIEAQMRMPDGSHQNLPGGTVRITEYTVGPLGLEAMVAPLPPNTVYTYAAEFSIDEAVDAGATAVTFSEPVVTYVDNFIGAPVGSAVPVGYYDRFGDRTAFSNQGWVAEDDGVVLQIVDISGGLAYVDLDGDSIAETDLILAERGITPAERVSLAELYDIGKVLWRVSMPHFSPFDCNWLSGVAEGLPESELPVSAESTSPCEEYATGSRIGCLDQSLGETVPIAGTPVSLHYESNKHYRAAQKIPITISTGGLPIGPQSVRTELLIAGRRLSRTFQPPVPAETTFEYDGLDAFGRKIAGEQAVAARVCYDYAWSAIAAPSPSDLASWNAQASEVNAIVTFTPRSRLLGLCVDHPTSVFYPVEGSVGGWDLSVHHTLEPVSQRIYRGDGRIEKRRYVYPLTTSRAGWGRSALASCAQVTLFSEVGCGVGEQENPAGAQLYFAYVHTAAPDGTVFVADYNQTDAYLLRIRSNGASSRIFGRLTGASNTRPGTQVPVDAIHRVLVGPDGMLYVLVTIGVSIPPRPPGYQGGSLVYRVAQDGSSVEVVAGSYDGTVEDNVDATDAFLNWAYGMSFGPDGSLYIAENFRVRRVSPDGKIHTVAGLSTPSVSASVHTLPMDIHGRESTINRVATTVDFGRSIKDVAVADDGTLYIASSASGIYTVGVDGVIRILAGGAQWYGPPVERQAIPSNLAFQHIVVSKTNGAAPSVYATCGSCSPDAVYEIRDNMLIPLATRGSLPPTFNYQPGQSAGASVITPGLSLDADGNLLASGLYHVIKLWLRGQPMDDVAVSGDGTQLWEFASGKHVRTIDSTWGHDIFTFGYDASDRLASITDQYGNTTSITRDSSGNPTSVIPPFAEPTQLRVDEIGRLAEVEGPTGATHVVTYHGSSRALASFRNPTGATSTFQYDTDGRLVSNTDPEGNTQTLARSAYIADDTNWRNVETTRHVPGVDNPWVYRQESQSSATVATYVTAPNGATTQTISGSAERSWTTRPDGTQVTSQSALDPRLGSPYLYERQVRLPSGRIHTTRQTRTAAVADVNDPLSVTTMTNTVSPTGQGPRTATLDVTSRISVERSALGRERVTSFDEFGRVISVQVPGLHPELRFYDDYGRLETITIGTEPDARSVSFTYDADGNIATVEGPEPGDVLSMSYDLAGNPLSLTRAGQVTGFTNDAAGRVATVTPPGRPAHGFSHTARGQTASYTPPTIAGEPTTTSYEYRPDRQLGRRVTPDSSETQYDYSAASGQLEAASSEDETTEFAYQPATGKISALDRTDELGQHTLSFSYDGSLPTSESWSGDSGLTSGTVARTYNSALQVQSLLVNGTSVATYVYDGDGLLQQAASLVLDRDAGNGMILGLSSGSVATSYSYNGFGEPLEFSTAFDNQDVYVETVPLRDRRGRVLTRDESVVGPAGLETSTYSYVYDESQRLESVAVDGALSRSYVYDSNANRTALVNAGASTVHGRYDVQDRLLSYCPEDGLGELLPTIGLPCYSYSYDALGRLSSKSDLLSSDVTMYQYSREGALMGVTLPDGRQVEYELDPLGRRVGKRIDGQKQWGLLYDGRLRPVAQLDDTGQVASVFIYASKNNVPDLMMTAHGTFRLVSDALGSVRLVVNDATGAVVQRLDYDEFGQVLLDTNPGFQPFGFASGIYDADTGLTRFGARDYDPVVGRWTAKDPSLFRGGLNLYGYANNDPVNFIDITGHSPQRDWELWERAKDFFSRDGVPFDMPGGPSRSDHANRNQHNRCPSRPPTMCGGGTEDDFTFDNTPGVGGKYRGAGGSECAYDSNGNLMPDPNQTFNFYPDPWTPGHVWDDFGAHFWYGGADGYNGQQTTPY